MRAQNSIKIKPQKMKASKGDRALTIFFYIVIVLFAAVCLYPFYQILISSLSDESVLIRDGYVPFPSKLSLDAYKVIFATSEIPQAYFVTIGITLGGTVGGLLIMSMAAYALSGNKMKYSNAINFYLYFTCLFSGGIVTIYILITKYLRLTDNLLVYILPSMVNVWNLFLLRNFFNEIPQSLRESAAIDGAGEFTTAFKVILPLSLPGLATIGLFTSLAFWNEWMASALYINNEKLYTLQYIVVRMVNSITAAQNIGQSGLPSGILKVPAYTVRLATAIVTIGPIVFLYPFLQKYFVAGLRVGGIKG